MIWRIIKKIWRVHESIRYHRRKVWVAKTRKSNKDPSDEGGRIGEFEGSKSCKGCVQTPKYFALKQVCHDTESRQRDPKRTKLRHQIIFCWRGFGRPCLIAPPLRNSSINTLKSYSKTSFPDWRRRAQHPKRASSCADVMSSAVNEAEIAELRFWHVREVVFLAILSSVLLYTHFLLARFSFPFQIDKVNITLRAPLGVNVDRPWKDF